MHKLVKSETQLAYDLLSYEIDGSNEKALNQFCGGQLNCDILSLELSNPKLCFILRKSNLNLPIEKGILFEINYRDLLSSQSIRINTISNARLLIEKCKSKNILLSSGARFRLDFRCPNEVAFLGELFGMKHRHSRESVFWNACIAIKHSSKYFVFYLFKVIFNYYHLFNIDIRKIPISSVIDEVKGEENWLRKELKLNKEEDKTNLKRKDDLNDLNKNKKIKINN